MRAGVSLIEIGLGAEISVDGMKRAESKTRYIADYPGFIPVSRKYILWTFRLHRPSIRTPDSAGPASSSGETGY